MQFNFFKAGKPYDKTNGLFVGYIWTDGITGPLSLREVQRLSANMGGSIITVDCPEVDNIETLIYILRNYGEIKRLLKKSVEAKPVIEEVKKPEESQNVLTISTEAEVVVHDGEEKTDFFIPEGASESEVRVIAEACGVKLPKYFQMRRILADAREKGEFDYLSVIGDTKDMAATIRAYLLYLAHTGQLKQPEDVSV